MRYDLSGSGSVTIFEGVDYPRITENWLLEHGFVKDDLHYELEIGRKGFIVARAQDEDLILLYRHDIGIDYNELRFIEYTHELELVVLALTDTPLTLQA